MKVVHFQRKPGHYAFSIERLFEDIRSALPPGFNVEVCICRFPSKGLWRRVYDIFRAAQKQGDINHITGDVQFLPYLLKRRKTILTIHDCVSLERLHGLRYRIFWFFWFWVPIRRSAVITVISESTKKELQRHIGSDQFLIEVIPDCVSTEFQPHTKEFNENCPRILQIGTKKNKNIERVAEALVGISCKLVVIGLLSSEQTRALQTHKIAFENYVGLSEDEMVNQYRLADILILASLYEGFGLPILEAQMVGRPVITSNLYSMPEVGGDAACYVDPYDVAAIRSAIKKVLSDAEYRDLLIRKGFKNASKFKSGAIAKQYADLYQRLYSERA